MAWLPLDLKWMATKAKPVSTKNQDYMALCPNMQLFNLRVCHLDLTNDPETLRRTIKLLFILLDGILHFGTSKIWHCSHVLTYVEARYRALMTLISLAKGRQNYTWSGTLVFPHTIQHHKTWNLFQTTALAVSDYHRSKKSVSTNQCDKTLVLPWPVYCLR